MKKIFLVLLLLVSTDVKPMEIIYPYHDPLTFNEMASLKVTDSDCGNRESIRNWLKDQLAKKSLLGIDPEQMTEVQRKYNGMAHSAMWALDINCADKRAPK